MKEPMQDIRDWNAWMQEHTIDEVSPMVRQPKEAAELSMAVGDEVGARFYSIWAEDF